MDGYQKKITYLDYLENGMKINSAGFAKLEERDGRTRLEMRIKNIPERFSGEYDLLADGNRAVARLTLNQGNGSCCIVWDRSSSSFNKEALYTDNLHIRLPDGSLVQAVWREPLRVFADSVENESESMAEEAVSAGNTLPVYQLWETVMEPELQISSSETMSVQEPVCYGDKWEQLLHTYPVIHPFDDEREFLSIAPKDFVIMCREYQKMVHNSFLLHGYYNYRHLILGRIAKDSSWYYYLGVPGNYYDREKMVAEMFGFEAFEGAKESAKPGDFGYFMKQVNI